MAEPAQPPPVALPAAPPGGPASATDLIPVGTWTVDPDHSGVFFKVQHLGITTLRGRFTDVAGAVDVAEADLHGEGVVGAGSVFTGNPIRDSHLQGPDFLDSKTHPQLVLAFGRLEPSAEGRAAIAGTLTIRGVTRPVRLLVQSSGVAQDPYGHERVGLALRADIDRRDFDIAFDAAGALVGWSVRIELDLSLVRTPDYLPRPERRAADEAEAA